ncbi:MAG: hypothetical protein HC915_12990 [Anaerolineae bacterium]|nr:hypothetical protein [Anaerolineae bacterium]
MSEQEMKDLAEHLAKMRMKRARNEIRRLDTEARLKFWRNAVGMQEWHTTYELPGLGVRVVLVENRCIRPPAKRAWCGPKPNT